MVDLPEDVCLARQAIFDTDMQVCGYELLYRPTLGAIDPRAAPTAAEETTMTAATVTAALTDIGLNVIVGDNPAWVNVGADFLKGDLGAVLPPDRTVIEVLETVPGDDALFDAIDQLKGDKYLVALDDFVWRPESERLLELADIVKLDVLHHGADLATIVDQLKRHEVDLVAEKVETYEMLDRCRDLGFTRFQGNFLEKPRMFSTVRVSAEAAVRLQLVARMNDPDIGFSELSELIATDVTLSYRLLRYINSAYIGLRKPVSSVREALIALGSRRVRSWATLLFLADAGAGRQELVVTALVRARMCQTLADTLGVDTERAFMAGLLSVVDALIDRPLEDALGELPLDGELTSALLVRDGALGDLLQRVVSFEHGDFGRATAPPVGAAAATRAYIESLDWANQLMGGIVD